ncbi:MAG: metallophosphoesterase [Pseudomonadota bacterium]
MSDLHIVPEGDLSHALDTAERLELAVEHINTHHQDAAFCVLLGDLADRGDAASYERLKELTSEARIPLHLTLGNHDHRPTFLEVFGASQANPATGCIDFALDLDETKVLVLDSSEPGLTAGTLEAGQLEWLAEELDGAKDRRVVLLIHHAITELGVPTDFINLQEPERFVDAALAHGNVEMVVTGHVHMSTAGTVRQLPFTSLAGAHYNIFPQMGGDIATVPRFDGPGQLGNILLTPQSVIVHHESFFDRHVKQPAPLHAWVD